MPSSLTSPATREAALKGQLVAAKDADDRADPRDRQAQLGKHGIEKERVVQLPECRRARLAAPYP
jgi:hypothetical protein